MTLIRLRTLRLRTLIYRFARPETLRQGTVVLAATSGANLLNFLYHLVMGRLLPPAEYGVLMSLLAAVMVLVIPAGVIQTVIAHYSSGFRALGQWTNFHRLLKGGSAVLTLIGVGLLLVIALGKEPIAHFLKVPSSGTVLVAGGVLLMGLVMPVTQGTLQGLQLFGHFGGNIVAGTLCRFVSGVGLVLLGLGAAGALAGSIVAGLPALAIMLLALRTVPRPERAQPDLHIGQIARYARDTFLVLLAFGLLTNIDVIAAKHFFAPAEAGYYAAAATLGKVSLYAPGAVALVLFPKSTHSYALGTDGGLAMLRKSVLLVMLLCTPIVGGYFLFPRLAVSFLFGDRYAPSEAILVLLALAMALHAVNYLFITHHLATQHTPFVWVAIGCAALGALLVGLFHASATELATVTVINALAFLLLSEIFCPALLQHAEAWQRVWQRVGNGRPWPPRERES